ncbi:MAG: ABC transporter permease, partial [Planctomycetes bacterium]|nr:ABC transporter permease [Planctomycetota bacterium]
MAGYVASIWRCRYFWISLVGTDLRTRYRRSVLGIGWSLLHPIAMTLVLCMVFHNLFGLDVRAYGISLLMGLCLWNFITAVTLEGCQCLFRGDS